MRKEQGTKDNNWRNTCYCTGGTNKRVEREEDQKEAGTLKPTH